MTCPHPVTHLRSVGPARLAVAVSASAYGMRLSSREFTTSVGTLIDRSARRPAAAVEHRARTARGGKTPYAKLSARATGSCTENSPPRPPTYGTAIDHNADVRPRSATVRGGVRYGA